uniref:Uncharacterized protein n=1 Tax=uncultured Alphaproteobacteria bacterium TaxID=91750 RepID=A0A6M4NND5_9PROT|nr:hypothetical protein PlAlph_2450 [uncultured Alphaproteobacteria bacterium]
MDKNSEDKKGMVVMDIDGVINSFSNRKFYLSFVYKSIKNLAKVHGRRKLLASLPEARKAGGPNGLFCFIRNYCGDEKTFNAYNRKLVNDLNFDLISPDPSLRAFMKRLNKHGDIIVRSDGLSAVADAVWQRVMENKPSAEIKKELLSQGKLPSHSEAQFEGKKISFSGIDDNNMRLKTDMESWKDFAKRYNFDIQKSVLIDDSRSNVKIGKALGMTTVRVSKLDSFLQGTPLKNLMARSLSDILGTRMSETLKHCQIAYGQKVDIKTLFRTLLEKTSGFGYNNIFKHKKDMER